jgi:hypothetical protein
MYSDWPMKITSRIEYYCLMGGSYKTFIHVVNSWIVNSVIVNDLSCKFIFASYFGFYLSQPFWTWLSHMLLLNLSVCPLHMGFLGLVRVFLISKISHNCLKISLCDICEANKSPSKLPRAPLGVIPVGVPLDRNATDLLGPLPETPRGNKYSLTVTDYFTKCMFPCRNTSYIHIYTHEKC